MMQIGGCGSFSARSINVIPSSPVETQIGDEDIDRLAFQHVHRAANIFRDVGVVVVLEQAAQTITRVLLVVDDENSWLERIPFHIR